MNVDTNPLVTGPTIQIRIVADNPHSSPVPSLLECSQFLVDLNLAYEISRIVTDPKYRDFRFSPTTYSRSAKRLEPADCIWVRSLSFNSPLEIVGYIAAVPAVPTALWVMLQIIDKVRAMGIEHKMRRVNLEKAQLEVKKLQRDIGPVVPDPLPMLTDDAFARDTSRPIERASERLHEHPLSVTDIDFDYIKRLQG